MTKAGELYALAQRCEMAEGPDRMIDAEIVVAFDLRPDWLKGAEVGELWIDREADLPDPPIRWNSLGKRSPGNPPIGSYPRYTASLDAAKSLIHPRALWAHGSMEEGPFARLCWPMPNGGFDGGYQEATAATVSLATCAAALRALAASLGRGGTWLVKDQPDTDEDYNRMEI